MMSRRLPVIIPLPYQTRRYCLLLYSRIVFLSLMIVTMEKWCSGITFPTLASSSFGSRIQKISQENSSGYKRFCEITKNTCITILLSLTTACEYVKQKVLWQPRVLFPCVVNLVLVRRGQQRVKLPTSSILGL